MNIFAFIFKRTKNDQILARFYAKGHVSKAPMQRVTYLMWFLIITRYTMFLISMQLTKILDVIEIKLFVEKCAQFNPSWFLY